MAVVLLCVLASAAYCLNDVKDSAQDRLHPEKRSRPVAAGEVTPFFATALGCALGVSALAAMALLGQELLVVGLLYSLIQCLYMSHLKHVAVADLLSLALLYLLRVLAGVAVTGITPSTWLMNCTALLALMLAAGKRLLELGRESLPAGSTRAVLTRYSERFLAHLLSASGAATLLCYLLWCSETSARGRFLALEIYPTVVPVAFGLLRYQLAVFGGTFDEDPARGLLRDRSVLGAVIAFTLWLAWIMYIR